MTKKLIYIIIFIIIFIPKVFADTQSGFIEYNGYQYAFQPGDEIKFEQYANKNMKSFARSYSESNKKFYLNEALRYAFMLSKLQPNSIEAQVIMGRCYDEMGMDTLAKSHFFFAYNLDSQNPSTNFYFANFYYKRCDLINALDYYKTAYQNGYGTSFFLNKRIGNIYEKLGDLETAKRYYQKAVRLNRKASALSVKIHSLDELNYSQSQYYLFKK